MRRALTGTALTTPQPPVSMHEFPSTTRSEPVTLLVRPNKSGPTMLVALVDGQRREPQRGLVGGVCPFCKMPVTAKCGNERVHHWAHKPGRDQECDPWKWEESDWHLNWKNQFPLECREVIHTAENGEKHRADVKTVKEWVLEFQHSPLTPEERQSREAFYPKLVWVVDGAGKRARAQLLRAWDEGRQLNGNGSVRRAYSLDFAFLQRWAGSNALVFFDLGEAEQLLWVLGTNAKGLVYLYRLPRQAFLEWHRSTAAHELDNVSNVLRAWVADYEARQAQLQAQLQAQPSAGWDPLALRRPRRSFRL